MLELAMSEKKPKYGDSKVTEIKPFLGTYTHSPKYTVESQPNTPKSNILHTDKEANSLQSEMLTPSEIVALRKHFQDSQPRVEAKIAKAIKDLET